MTAWVLHKEAVNEVLGRPPCSWGASGGRWTRSSLERRPPCSLVLSVPPGLPACRWALFPHHLTSAACSLFTKPPIHSLSGEGILHRRGQR